LTRALGFKLSGQADIYAYLFFHTARFLKEGGRMGFVTSNSWLDVGYGYELQKFLLNNFKLVAILESRCEPWFEDAAINTIVTIVERCSTKEERDNHIAKFIRVKKRLAELIPWDMKLEASKRWFGLGALVYRIESVGKEHYKIEKEAIVNTLTGLESYEDDDFRIRFIKQGELLDKLNDEGKTAKWGQFLRAPQIYYEMMASYDDRFTKLDDVVTEIKCGIKTGVNEFFYFTEEKTSHWGIEDEFLVPIIKSPRESECIIIEPASLQQKLFVCNLNKAQLKKKGKSGALRYIEWGEQQSNAEGQRWNKVQSVSSRENWYALGDRKPGHILPFINSGDIHRVLYNPSEVYVDHNLFEVSAEADSELGLLLYLNSSVAGLFKELIGRANLGEGGLKVEGVDWNSLTCPKAKYLKELSKLGTGRFDKLLERPVKSIFEEVKMKDRQKLDSLILQALGLDPDKYLKPIYDGLTQLVRERIELANMRKKVKQVKTQRDVDRLKKQVMEEVLPNGLKKFPDEFLEAPLKPQDYQNISIPCEPLKLGMFFLGTQQVVSDSGFTFEAKSVDEAKYAIYSQKPDTFVVSLPKDSVVITKAVNDYERYLRKLRDDLFQALFKRTFDHKLSDTLMQRAFAELGLPDIATT
jgi:hypothetical protein